MKRSYINMIAVLVVVFLLSSNSAFAAWNTPSDFCAKIKANPVNGGFASAESIWNSGTNQYDIEVKFNDNMGVERTKTITSVGDDELVDPRAICAVDPTSGDVAVAWCSGSTFKYKVYDEDGTSSTATAALNYDAQGTDASDWDYANFIDTLPTMKQWDNSDGTDKFEGWVDITHSGVSGDGWHIAVSYMYAADCKWDDFFTTFGSAQTYSQSILFRYATVVFQNAGTVDEDGIEIFSSDDDVSTREYFDHPNVRLHKEWVKVPAKVTPITSVLSSGNAVSGVLYVPTYGAIYYDDLEWAENGVTCGSLSLAKRIKDASVATSEDTTGERVHIAYDNNIVYKTPGSGSWSAGNAIVGAGEDIADIVAIPDVLDSLYVVVYEFDAETTYGGGAIYDEYWYYDLYYVAVKKISSVDGTESVDATYSVSPGSGEAPAYWAYTRYVSYPGTGTIAINESTAGTPSKINIVFNQADWRSMNRYDEDWEAIAGGCVLATDTSP